MPDLLGDLTYTWPFWPAPMLGYLSEGACYNDTRVAVVAA